MAFFHTGATYRRRGCIPAVYIVFRSACFSPQFSFADLESANINFVHFFTMWFMCSLNESLLSNIIPKYFKLCTCWKSLLLRYISISFLFFSFSSCQKHYFWFLLIEFNFIIFCPCWNMLSSTFAMFCASLIESAFIMITRSSAKATVFVWLLYLRLNKELYVPKTRPATWHLWAPFGNVLHFTDINRYVTWVLD